MNEVFNSTVPIKWSQTGDVATGTFEVDNDEFKIKIEAATWEFQNAELNFLNCAFTKTRGGKDTTTIEGSDPRAGKIIGAVVNGIRDKLKELEYDALIFT